MSQYDFATIVPTTTSGAQLATALNGWRAALESLHQGSTRPTYARSGTMWLDIAAAPWLLKVYDGTDDIVLGAIDATTNLFIVPNSALLNGKADTAFATAGQGVKADAALPATAQAVDSAKLGGQLPSDYRDAGKLTGELADARLSDNVPLKNATNTFTAGQVNSGVVGNKTIANYAGNADLQIQASSGGAALMSFHRPGAYAGYFGLDTDNQWKVGGWSAGAVGYVLIHTGNAGTLVPSVGVGQTWQDVTASRAKDTVYQNTTGKPIQTAIQGRGQSGILSVSHDNVAWIGVGQTAGLTNGYQSNIDIIVPNGYYYRLAGTDSIARWVELR